MVTCCFKVENTSHSKQKAVIFSSLVSIRQNIIHCFLDVYFG
jgi:hypothetical protein